MQNLLQMKRQEPSGFDLVFQPLLGALEFGHYRLKYMRRA